MKRREGQYNGKRRLRSAEEASTLLQALTDWAQQLSYGGNPEHKRHPGDFGLTPPAAPRLAKSLCDDAGVTRREDALMLLREGFSRGLLSRQIREDGWPQNVWAVTQDGVPLEAQREGTASYHGYPMPDNDPFRNEVLARWYGA